MLFFDMFRHVTVYIVHYGSSAGYTEYILFPVGLDEYGHGLSQTRILEALPGIQTR